MALTNLEYGSLASSEILNKNFLYLDDKIAETTTDLNTSISSILSNIATINTRILELSNTLSDSMSEFTTNLNNLKTKTQDAINASTLVPEWSSCISLTSLENYSAPSNGYVMINPTNSTSGNLIVNGVAVLFKKKDHNYDHSAQLVAIPVKKDDVVTYTSTFNNAYFLPVVSFGLES